MKKTLLIAFQFLALCLVVTAGVSAAGGRAADQPDPRKLEIAKTAEAFVAAFQAGDAKAVAAFWTDDGDFVDIGGRVIKGRPAIEADFADLFRQNKGLKVHIHIEQVRFPSADTAIEDGVSSVHGPAGTLPNRAKYTNILVKKDGKWLLSSVREAAYTPPSNRDKLQGLEWLIGEWADTANAGHTARVIFDWTPDQNFIFSMKAVQVGDAALDNGSQRIGWDPIAKNIRSWNFEADGGFGESVWTKTNDTTWTIKTTSVLVSGHKATWTGIVTQVDADTVTWQMKEQTVDGNATPDGPVVTLKRVK